MSQAVPNPDRLRADREELEQLRDLKRRLETEASDLVEPGAILTEWAQETGAPAPTDALTLRDIQNGRYSDEELAARGDEVRKLLDPSYRETGGAVTAEQLQAMPQREFAQAVAELGAERVQEILISETAR